MTEKSRAADLGFTAGDLMVVTGAGSGIGRATARMGAAAGLAVAAWDLDGGTAEGVAAEVTAAGGTAWWARVDVTDAEEVAAGFAGLDRPARYLVNNAGPPSAVATAFADGLVMGAGSMELVTRAWMGTELPEGAAVVNVASVAGNCIGSSPDWYAATKAAVTGYTRHLAAWQADRIRANAVAPGMIATPRSAGFADSEPLMRALARNPVHRMGEPEEIAGPILFLLSPLATYVNGALLVADGGWTIAP
ncbi:MAG TPA: SDR family oxidoreductase [Acidimicrobiales bacterium]|nr:SDR family oxidoreductase [Acidimicrobiales bacterium]